MTWRRAKSPNSYGLPASGKAPPGAGIVIYIPRPTISNDRLRRDERGRIPYRLRHPYRDGTTHVVFTQTSFLKRLCALIPRPHKHMWKYHGVLTPASSWRPESVPPPSSSRSPTRTPLDHHLRRAELIRRIFDADVLQCECGARRRLGGGLQRSSRAKNPLWTTCTQRHLVRELSLDDPRSPRDARAAFRFRPGWDGRPAHPLSRRTRTPGFLRIRSGTAEERAPERGGVGSAP